MRAHSYSLCPSDPGAGHTRRRFITMGALFSILLSTGVETHGLQLLLQGLGFSVGFFLVILTGAALFTEANVLLPVSALNCSRTDMLRRGIKFWVLAWVGNLIGTMLTGWVVSLAQVYSPEHYELLSSVVAKKMHYQQVGGAEGWFSLVLSGMLGNWMVGMAAFLAVMGRTIIDKFVPIFLAVSLFVAGNFQHSPANMAYFSMIMPTGAGPGWWDAMRWSIIPAGIGNILGGSYWSHYHCGTGYVLHAANNAQSASCYDRLARADQLSARQTTTLKG
ncbi:formate/nitrite transporter family protein [Cobetia crustatorum]|uniref:formate/nitrite transporter family protein n=1 Tax=Cobetia crustatorum TaxID=553385 RepID=UPI0006872CBE|nr:formate/nitrite transporter family protein [Cobetia crustatorum]